MATVSQIQQELIHQGMPVDVVAHLDDDPANPLQKFSAADAQQRLEIALKQLQLLGTSRENKQKYIKAKADSATRNQMLALGTDAPLALSRAVEEYDTIVANRKKAGLKATLLLAAAKNGKLDIFLRDRHYTKAQLEGFWTSIKGRLEAQQLAGTV
jgi:hypothetical protein